MNTLRSELSNIAFKICTYFFFIASSIVCCYVFHLDFVNSFSPLSASFVATLWCEILQVMKSQLIDKYIVLSLYKNYDFAIKVTMWL